MRAVIVLLGLLLLGGLAHSCGESDDIDYNIPPTTDAEVLRRYPDNGLSLTFYCWDVGAPEPHHFGYRVSGDHPCSYGELRAAGVDGYWSLGGRHASANSSR